LFFCGDFAAILLLKFGKYFQKWKLYFLIRNIEKPFIYGSFSIFSLCDPVGIQNTKYLEIVLKWFVLKISILQS